VEFVGGNHDREDEVAKGRGGESAN